MEPEQQPPEPNEPQDPPASQEQPEQQPKPPWGTDEEFNPEKAWKLIQNLRAEKDELRPLAQRARELEEAQKSEEQKLQERISGLEADARDAARLRVALRKGLTETQAKRLVGDTLDELEADADELLASFNPSDPADTGRRPSERLRPGATPSTEPFDPNRLADDILGGLRI